MQSRPSFVLTGLLLLGASVLAAVLFATGPAQVDRWAVEMFREQQTLLAEQAARRIEQTLSELEARLDSSLERQASGIAEATTRAEYEAALARLARPSDRAIGALFLVHEEDGHLLAAHSVDGSVDLDDFVKHDHLPQPAGNESGLGACESCIHDEGQLSVTTQLDDRRRLAVNVGFEQLAGETFRQITQGRNKRAALLDARGVEQHVVQTAETGTDWITGRVALPGTDWHVEVAAPRRAIAADIDRSTRRLLLGSGGVLLLVLLGLGSLGLSKYRQQEEQIRQVRALAHQEKLATLGTLGASVAHEINNSLGAAQANISLLRARAEDQLDPKDLQLIDRAFQAIEQLAELSRELNVYARKAQEPSEFSVVDAAESALRIVRPKLGDHASIDLEVDAEPILSGHPTALTQVLVNLILNAHEAIDGDEPHIFLRITRRDRTAVITVSDNGPGVPERLRDQIFEPFFTTKNGDEQDGGTGIGLWLCARNVELHDGEIRVESAAEGGARFVIELPLDEAADDALPTDPAPLAQRRSAVG